MNANSDKVQFTMASQVLLWWKYFHTNFVLVLGSTNLFLVHMTWIHANVGRVFTFIRKKLILVLVPIPLKNGTWNLVSSFGHNGLEHPFSEVERNSNLQKFSKLAPLPKKGATKKRRWSQILQKRKNERARKNWAHGEVLHLITKRNEAWIC